MDISNKILSEITVYMKYAKYRPELQRRETWEELVTRNKTKTIGPINELKKYRISFFTIASILTLNYLNLMVI